MIEQLKNLPYFDKKTIYQLSEQYGLKKTTVDAYISRSLKRKDIIPLKRGLYVSTDYFEKNKSDTSYLFYLANILRTPSYISSWTALQYFNLATEMIYPTTSITNKVTRTYQTKIGNFTFQSIQNEFFTGFFLVKGKFDFFIASPAKALFDLLYFKTRRFRGIDVGNIKSLISELRIDFDEMDKNEQEKFFQMIKKYAKK